MLEAVLFLLFFLMLLTAQHYFGEPDDMWEDR